MHQIQMSRSSFRLDGSCARTIDFDDVFGHVHELVHQPLAIDFGQNPSLIVIPAR